MSNFVRKKNEALVGGYLKHQIQFKRKTWTYSHNVLWRDNFGVPFDEKKKRKQLNK